MVEILRELAAGLDVRCIGIKKTNHAPDFSVETLAKYSISLVYYSEITYSVFI